MGRYSELPEPWHSLGLALNSGQRIGLAGALAAAFGVGRLTVRRWASGESPLEGPALQLFLLLCKMHRIDPTKKN